MADSLVGESIFLPSHPLWIISHRYRTEAQFCPSQKDMLLQTSCRMNQLPSQFFNFNLTPLQLLSPCPMLSSLISHALWHIVIPVMFLLIMPLTWQAAVFILSAKLANSHVKTRWEPSKRRGHESSCYHFPMYLFCLWSLLKKRGEGERFQM